MDDNIQTINIDSMLNAISTIIKEQKEFLGITVADLSKRSGVSVGVISDLINNRGRVPSLANFINLAIALELPEDMFTGLLQGKIEQVRKANQGSRQEVEDALRRYGLSQQNIDNIIIQIDALIQNQTSHGYERKSIFNDKHYK